MKRWKVTVKRITEPLPIVTEVEGDCELEDIRRDFGLIDKSIEWFTVEEKGGGDADD